MKKHFLVFCLSLVCLSSYAIVYDEDGVSPGYRGFFDFSYNLGVGHWGKNHDRVNIMTSHGYQIVPQLFVGLGVGGNYFYDDKAWNLPVFMHFRSDLIQSEISPFIDLRVGYSFLDVEGFYLNPAIGCRFSVTDNFSLNLAIGYTLQKAEYYYSGSQNCSGIDFRFGFDF